METAQFWVIKENAKGVITITQSYEVGFGTVLKQGEDKVRLAEWLVHYLIERANGSSTTVAIHRASIAQNAMTDAS